MHIAEITNNIRLNANIGIAWVQQNILYTTDKYVHRQRPSNLWERIHKLSARQFKLCDTN